tara:strand:- start:108 stop:746 length:639 start_codon:yes stop_codon:yes gene_type:complete
MKKTPVARSSKVKMPKKTDAYKKCSKKTTKVGCDKMGDDCAWDPKKNPKCAMKEPSVYDQFVSFHSDKLDLHFSYPVTEHGMKRCYFVWQQKPNGSQYLYLRYSEELLSSMKKKYAQPLKMWYCKYGEKLINKRLEDLDDNLKVEAYRIGTPIKLSAHMVEQLEADQLYMGPGNPDPAGHGQCGDPDDLPDLDPLSDDDSRAESPRYDIEVM